MPSEKPRFPLISPLELRNWLSQDHPPVVLDIRWSVSAGTDRSAFEQAHLPGARFVDLETELAGPPGSEGRHPLPATAAFEAAMSRVGVSNDADVVVYDEADSTACARLWWLLRYFGHEHVQVLDGGLRAWLAEGGETESGTSEIEPGNFSASPGGLKTLTAEEAAIVAQDGVLLDARAFVRYTGEDEPVDPKAGHILGAISAPTTSNLDDLGRFLSPARLRERFAELGCGGTGVATYCGSGITGAHQVLAGAIAGIDVGLFAGSWSGWITDPTRPIAVGEAPGRFSSKLDQIN